MVTNLIYGTVSRANHKKIPQQTALANKAERFRDLPKFWEWNNEFCRCCVPFAQMAEFTREVIVLVQGKEGVSDHYLVG